MGMTAGDALGLSATGRLGLTPKARKAKIAVMNNSVCRSIRLQLQFILQAGFKAELDAMAIQNQSSDWTWQPDEKVEINNALVNMVTERLAFAMARPIGALEASIEQTTAALLASPGPAWSPYWVLPVLRSASCSLWSFWPFSYLHMEICDEAGQG